MSQQGQSLNQQGGVDNNQQGTNRGQEGQGLTGTGMGATSQHNQQSHGGQPGKLALNSNSSNAPLSMNRVSSISKIVIMQCSMKLMINIALVRKVKMKIINLRKLRLFSSLAIC